MQLWLSVMSRALAALPFHFFLVHGAFYVVKNRAFMAMFLALIFVDYSVADVVVLSDSFSRANPGTPIGTAPTKDTTAASQTAAAANWVSSWGANNNAAGGYVSQTYTTYNSGGGTPANYKVDGTNAISGNWLNNGSAAHPLAVSSGGTTTEAIGMTGFAWTQVNHNFATDTTVQAAPLLRINFDLYRSTTGNVSWFLGQNDATGVANGTAGSPATVASNDISLYFRGVNASTFGLRDNGVLPTAAGITSYDTMSYAGGTPITPSPLAIQIDITGTTFGASQNSLLELWVNGVQQDLNGTAIGSGYAFSWDSDASAFMGFGSNNSPVGGTVASPVFQASGIDNLRITAVPEPATMVLIGCIGLVGLGYQIRRKGLPIAR